MTYFHRVASFSVAVFLFHATFHISNVRMNESEDSGEALILTPYIESGKIDEARELSRVNLPDSADITSYSGFFKVNKTYNSHMFFWFVPATEDDAKTVPIMMWLNGGPGQSSLMGFFSEHGPYFLYPNMTTGLREYAWTKHFSIIYVDNPVGAGYSFTDSDEGYSRSQDDVAENLFQLTCQFFTMFPEYSKNDFYVAGESYGGKYAPALSYKIHQDGEDLNANFKGMVVGNGLTDPEYMIGNTAQYFYQLGLIDRIHAEIVKSAMDKVIQLIQNEDYLQAASEYNKIIGLPFENSYLGNVTGFENGYNFLLSKEPKDVRRFRRYVLTIGNAIHVGDRSYQSGDQVRNHFSEEFVQSVKPKAKVVMENYRVMFYSGQMDLVVPYPMTVNFLQSVDWKYAKEYKEAERIIWRLKDSDYVAGYVHNVKDFYEVMVRNSGHMVPHDLPEVGLDLITRFLKRESFD